MSGQGGKINLGTGCAKTTRLPSVRVDLPDQPLLTLIRRGEFPFSPLFYPTIFLQKMKCVPSRQSLRFLRSLVGVQPAAVCSGSVAPFLRTYRSFHASPPLGRIETHRLSDIGEGVKEVQVIQWFVEEGAPIEEWAPLCEVQSDKASVEITSKYTGIVKKLHFAQDDIVQVGEPMVDIELERDAEDVEEEQAQQDDDEQTDATGPEQADEPGTPDRAEPEPAGRKELGKYASLATPAVRGLLKEHGIEIENIPGTGKDGRVLKEDVYKYLETRDASRYQNASTFTKLALDATQTETAQKLTLVQTAMFKSMTASLAIPHFLYSDTIDITNLASMRTRLNATRNPETTAKLSYLPFMIKAVSLALNKYPRLNARLDTLTNPGRPQLILRSNHNIGIAMDTPNGLLVPVIKSVNARSISSIAQEIQRLSQLGQAGKLGTNDLSGGTITVSNIGNIGGEVLAPVIVEDQLAIMGVGKVKTVPVFGPDGTSVKPAQMVTVSWSADHRVVDGATMARMAQVVQAYLEEPATMVVDMT